MNIFKMFDEHVIGTTSGHFMIVCTPNNDSSVVRRATELMTSAHMYRRVIFMNSGSASTLEQALADVIDARVEPFSVGDLTNTLLIVPASWAWCPVVRDLMTSHAGGSMIVVANQLSDMPGSVRANANYIMSVCASPTTPVFVAATRQTSSGNIAKLENTGYPPTCPVVNGLFVHTTSHADTACTMSSGISSASNMM